MDFRHKAETAPKHNGIDFDSLLRKAHLYFIKKWWPVIPIIVLIIWAVFEEFLPLEARHGNLLSFLLQGATSYAIILYVIFTADLAQSTKITAEANRMLLESTQSMILEMWEVKEQENVQLARNGEALSHALYIQDKHMSEANYTNYLQRGKKRTLFLKLRNSGARTIIFHGAKIQVADSRSRMPREISIDPSEPMIIRSDRMVTFAIIYEFEGEIDARIIEINYRDGNRILAQWITNPYSGARYSEPESSASS